MIEYTHARVRVNNFTMVTVVNLTGRMETMSLLEIESTMQINIVCLRNVQNKPTRIECNSHTGFLNLRATDLRRHERYDY